MARQNLGARPSRPHDYVDIEWVETTYPSLSGYVSSATGFTVPLPAEPVPNTMYLLEVYAQAPIVVAVSQSVVLTAGTTFEIEVPTGKTAFFGFRYSATAEEWFFLSMATQV